MIVELIFFCWANRVTGTPAKASFPKSRREYIRGGSFGPPAYYSSRNADKGPGMQHAAFGGVSRGGRCGGREGRSLSLRQCDLNQCDLGDVQKPGRAKGHSGQG